MGMPEGIPARARSESTVAKSVDANARTEGKPNVVSVLAVSGGSQAKVAMMTTMKEIETKRGKENEMCVKIVGHVADVAVEAGTSVLVVVPRASLVELQAEQISF